jgi:nitrous oxidase accessory protein
MKRKWLAIEIILLFVGTCVIPTIAQDIEKPLPISRGNWLYVGGSELGNYTKIQDAIDNASDGDTIIVYYNVYNEDIIINKQLTLRGISQGEKKPVINGIDSNVVTIFADDLVFENFKVEDPYYYFSINANNNLINNCDIGAEIYFTNSSWNTISNSNIYKKGIFVDSNSHDNTFTQNNVSYTTGVNWHCGIEIASSTNNRILNNIFYHDWRGVYLTSAKNTTIINNSFDSCNIMMDGSSLEHFNSHTIENNIQGEKPIYYYVNTNGIIVPQDSNQIFLVNCTNCIINKLEIINYDYSINLYYSSYNKITNNTVKGINYAVYLFHSHSNLITNNKLENNTYAICFVYSNNNNFFKNSLLRNSIDLHGANSNIISYNVFNNHCGISVSGENNRVSKNSLNDSGISVWGTDNYILNNVLENHEDGIHMYSGGDNKVYYNTVVKCGYGIYDGAGRNIYKGNNFSFNTIGMYLLYGAKLIQRNNVNFNLQGICIRGGVFSKIINNNFIMNILDANIENSFFNLWLNNYWGLPLLHPKIIFGQLVIPISFYPPKSITIPWFNLDLRPRLTPIITI